MAYITKYQRKMILEGKNNIINEKNNSLSAAPCWAWALFGKNKGNEEADSAPKVYSQLQNQNFAVYDKLKTIPMPVVEGTRENWRKILLDVLNYAVFDKNPVIRFAAKNSYQRIMMRYMIRRAKLQPSKATTDYRIYMDAGGENGWLEWYHWGLAVKYQGEWGFMQTEPDGVPVYYGDRDLWWNKKFSPRWLNYVNINGISTQHKWHIDQTIPRNPPIKH